MTNDATTATIAAALEADFLRAVSEDRAERWTPPDNLRLAPQIGEIRDFDELDRFLADLALRDRRQGVRDAAVLALQNRAGPGVVLLAERLTDYWQASELRVLIMGQYNAGH